MAMYVNAEQDRWARQNARANGQQAPQPTSNYTGTAAPPVVSQGGGAQQPQDQAAMKRRQMATRANGGGGAPPPVVAAPPQRPAQVGPNQVRDRAFAQSEQSYRSGAQHNPNRPGLMKPGTGVVGGGTGKPPAGAAIRTGSVPGMSGPAATQPTLTSALPIGWSAPNQQSVIPTGMQYSGPQLAGPPGSNPTDGMSVLGPSGQPMSEGGAGTAGPGYNDVQTRRDSQTPLQWAEQAYQNWSQNAQDNAAGNEENNATYTGAQGSYTPSDNPEEAGTYSGSSKEADATAAAGQGDAALERELNRLYPNLSEDGQPFTLNDYQGSFVLPEGFFGGNGILPNPNPNGNESPATDLATWLATMIGEPFGAAATTLNKYGRQTKDAYMDNWSDLAPLFDVGKELMDPTKLAQYEDAARARMTTSVGNERDAANRRLMGQAGRGGAIGTGAQTGVGNAAMRAMMEGEQRLIEDSFRRKMASQQLGAGIYGDATRAKYGALEGGDISPGELAGLVIPPVIDAAGNIMEGVGGSMGDGPGLFPFLKLFGG